jgi:hypothetical protein
VQFQQPLTFLHVALSPGQIPCLARIHQPQIETVLFQYVVDRNPVHSGRLHYHRLDATFLEPPRLPVQVLRETAKVPNGLRIAVWPYRRQMLSTADVDPRRVPVYYFQTGIIGPDTAA